MAGRGFIKIHREVMNHPIFKHEGLFRLWCYLLLRANWKASEWLIPGTTTIVNVDRGQFITGRESLHHDLYGECRGEKPSSRTVWRWMESLHIMQCIKMQTMSSRCTLVTICNYDTYQGEDERGCPAGVQQVSSTCPADVQHMSTIEETKNPISQETKNNTQSGFSLAFQCAWDSWPARRRVKKQTSLSAWIDAVSRIAFRFDGDSRRAEDWLASRVREYVKSPKGSGRFCSGIANWLVDGNYDDPDEAWQEGESQPASESQYEEIAPA